MAPKRFQLERVLAIPSSIPGTFFDNAEARVAFLPELDRTGHRSEAMTLCLTYIDGFSQWFC
jgi:hypothetical protein